MWGQTPTQRISGNHIPLEPVSKHRSRFLKETMSLAQMEFAVNVSILRMRGYQLIALSGRNRPTVL